MTPPRAKKRLTVIQAADALGISRQAVNEWFDRPGAPVEGVKGKRYAIWPDFPRFRDAEREKARAAPANFDEARARKTAAEAELAELELAKARAELVPVEEVVARWGKIAERIRARLVVMPGKVAPLVAERTVMECQGVIEREVADALSDLQEDAA